MPEERITERTTVEKRTTVVPDPAQGGTTNINIDPATGTTQVQRNEPTGTTGTTGTTVRKTTVEETTRD